MSKKKQKKVLGRGLDALLGDPDNSNCPPGSKEIEAPVSSLRPIMLLFSSTFSHLFSFARLFNNSLIPDLPK